VISYNREVYNHREIRAEIGADARWSSSSDTETVLRAFEK
jgi:asparagine synthetase B (glutamine-hydrolysing)